MQTVTDELLYRVITGSATESERELVESWLAASPANQLRHDEVAAVLGGLATSEASLATPRPPEAALIIARARLRGSAPPVPAQRWIPRLVGGVAAAAVATLVVALWPKRELERAGGSEHFATGAAQSTSIRLEDGTRVVLGPASRLRTSLHAALREAWLEGRAEFTVAPHADHPFVVHTPAGNATDLATQFVARSTGTHLQLAVFEGRVEVASAGGRAEAHAGQVIEVAKGTAPKLSTLGTGHSPTDWVRAALVFETATLADVKATLEAHYDIEVRVSPLLTERTVTAWFLTEPTATQAITAICRAVGARCSLNDSVAIVAL